LPTSTLTTSNVLYYPHIEFPDSTWLKGALCVWENVFRIVPAGYVPDDSDEVKEAVAAGVLRDIRLSPEDLKQARTGYTRFLESVPFIPDALDRDSEGQVLSVHEQKLDALMISELSDLIGTITRKGDWLELPRGLADGYLLYLADSVAKRRALPKLTDSDTLFVAMQYFAMGGNMDEISSPFIDGNQDTNTALMFRGTLPGGLEYAPMADVLKFRKANRDGRTAFRAAFEGLGSELARVEDPEHAELIVGQFSNQLKEANVVTAAKIKEFFADSENVLLYLAMPILTKAFELATKAPDSMFSLGALGFAGIATLADAAKTRRKEWVPAEATYLCRMHQKFYADTPFPTRMKRFDRMMDEFLND
jgi:hypothetical protein